MKEKPILILETLIDLLKRVDACQWDYALFIRGNSPWKKDSICAVLCMDDLESPDEIPPFAQENNLQYVLGIQNVQDVVSNLKGQLPAPSDDDLLKAFNFYIQNDAFLRL